MLHYILLHATYPLPTHVTSVQTRAQAHAILKKLPPPQSYRTVKDEPILCSSLLMRLPPAYNRIV